MASGVLGQFLERLAEVVGVDRTLPAGQPLAIGVSEEHEGQRHGVGQVGHEQVDQRLFGRIDVGGERDEALLQQLGDGRLGNDTLNEGAAVASELAAHLDEEHSTLRPGLCECVGVAGVPAQRAAIVEVRVWCVLGHEGLFCRVSWMRSMRAAMTKSASLNPPILCE